MHVALSKNSSNSFCTEWMSSELECVVIILAKIVTESFTAGVTINGCLPSSDWSVFRPMMSSLACNNPTTISLTSSGTGMWRLRGKVWQMASRTESWRSRFLAARLVTKMPAWEAEVGGSPYNLGFPATILLPQRYHTN